MTILLPVFLGAFVGFSLGLTGGGGAIFAVPLLVYGLGVEPRAAVGISLLTVGATAFLGFVQRARRQMVEIPTGLLFAVAGMAGAPEGARIARYLSDTILLGGFSLLMLLIAVRMWLNAGDGVKQHAILHHSLNGEDDRDGPTCHRDPQGRLRLTSACALLLVAVGLVSGLLTGLFGVGGGFIIVPALVVFSKMGMQRAIGTSLLIIALVSVSGVWSHAAALQGTSMAVVGLFTLGSIAGLLAGARLARRFSGQSLQKTFSAAIVVVALYMVGRTFLG